MENEILELLKNMDNKLNNLTNDVKDIKKKVINLEIASSDTAFSVAAIKEHVDDIEVDKMSILLLEESMIKIKKENYNIKKHLNIK
ncbi:MAG: hypothetical protein ACRC6T_11525 [Sarcina sp.]